MKGHGKVAAVVTTFKPDASLLVNLQRIAHQVSMVVVVDDSGRPASPTSFASSGLDNVVLLKNQANLGIAAALNRGVSRAADAGCEWILTLDDDTLVTENYVDEVFDFIEKRTLPLLGMVACSRATRRVDRGEEEYATKRTLITSGCIFAVATHRAVGGFDEDFFIDLVDFDFCTRLRKAGLAVVLLNKVRLLHKVGNSRKIELLGRSVVVYNHAPFRLYYQMRNVWFFAKKHFSYDLALCLYLLLDCIRLPVKALLFEDRKVDRLRYLLLGLFDGIRGRAGRLRLRIEQDGGKSRE